MCLQAALEPQDPARDKDQQDEDTQQPHTQHLPGAQLIGLKRAVALHNPQVCRVGLLRVWLCVWHQQGHQQGCKVSGGAHLAVEAPAAHNMEHRCSATASSLAHHTTVDKYRKCKSGNSTPNSHHWRPCAPPSRSLYRGKPSLAAYPTGLTASMMKSPLQILSPH